MGRKVTKKYQYILFTYLVFHTVTCKHVFHMIQEITNGIHVIQVGAVPICIQEHFIKCHSNLFPRTQRAAQTKTSFKML